MGWIASISGKFSNGRLKIHINEKFIKLNSELFMDNLSYKYCEFCEMKLKCQMLWNWQTGKIFEPHFNS